MKNSFGSAISLTIFGESHGSKIGAVIDGIAPGIKINEEYIAKRLSLRRPYGKISTGRQEMDEFQIVSGVYSGYTTGTPICILIPNADTKSKDYSEFLNTPRPSHADFSANAKYHGFQDYRGGGHFSGRITAALVAAGAIFEASLKDKGINVGTHILSLAGIRDREINAESNSDIEKLRDSLFPVLDESKAELMKARIEKASADGDSVGGILESVITGVPAGVGEPFFDSLESVISHLLFSIPGIKGVSFGAGFDFAEMTGSEANDPFATDGEKVYTLTNNNGGINGGISNGMPITVKCAVKPTPSIYKEQKSVSLSDMTNTELKINGRHDPAIIHRARAVVDACLAFAIADMLTVRYGTDFLKA